MNKHPFQPRTLKLASSLNIIVQLPESLSLERSSALSLFNFCGGNPGNCLKSMVATSLPTKPKLAKDHCVETKEDMENGQTNSGGCCKRSICWPLVKLLTFLVLLAFFSLILYGQVVTICYDLESNESEVKMTFERPTQVTFPAVTVCNNNPIQKSKFCKKYPEHCSSDENGLVVNRNAYQATMNWSASDSVPLGQSWQEFAKTCLLVHSSKEKQEKCERVKNIYYSMAYQNCFTFLSDVDKFKGDYRKAAMWMILDFQPEENIENHTIVGGQLFIHDYEERIPEGFPISSYTLKPGKMYRYRLTQTNYYRLPPPYETGCQSYDDKFDSFSQQECYNRCLYNKFKIACGCMPDIIPFFNVKHDTSYCKRENGSDGCVELERRAIEESCNEHCPIRCEERKYHVKVDEIDVPDYNSDNIDKRKNVANIWIKFESNEQKTYNEIPAFTDGYLIIHLAVLYSAGILVLLFMTVGTIIDMSRICKSSKNSVHSN